MSNLHAVLWVDHQHAQVMHLETDSTQVQKIKAHIHHTRQHGSKVRTEHEFFGEVCDAMAGVSRGLAPRTWLALGLLGWISARLVVHRAPLRRAPVTRPGR